MRGASDAPRSHAHRAVRPLVGGDARCSRHALAARGRRRASAPVDLHPEEAIAAATGASWDPPGSTDPGAFAPDGHLVGVYEDDGAKARPLVILPPAAERSEGHAHRETGC